MSTLDISMLIGALAGLILGFVGANIYVDSIFEMKWAARQFWGARLIVILIIGLTTTLGIEIGYRLAA